ncbi:MAG: phosphatidylserine decarboxylase [Bdellovibrionaceae bacterium]|nr:phosphatidylserine decarboxylase [Pseudobdellovibrionaceae bacterium]
MVGTSIITKFIPKKSLAKMLKNQVMNIVVPQLPKKQLSHYIGSVAYNQWPKPLADISVKMFAKLVGINVEEAEKPLDEYKTVGEFFSRKLKAGARPIQGSEIHPCDSRITQSGKIVESVLIQAKGIKYTLEEFLPQTPWADSLEKGTFTTYYLSPKDYHRVHAPKTGKIAWVKYFPGELWPVNFWSLRNVPGVLAINERVAIGIDTPAGKMIMVMVGATNVGSMTFAFDASIKTNQYPFKNQRLLIEYPKPKAISVGDEVGTFNLGSTVVLLTTPQMNWPVCEPCVVKMGESIT